MASSTVNPLRRSTAGLMYERLKSSPLTQITSVALSARSRYFSSLSRSASSARLRSVMSWPSTTIPPTGPASSASGT